MRLLYGKRPVVLAEITRGPSVYRYHLGRRDVTFMGNVFKASTLSYSSIVYSSETRKDDLTLQDFPLSDPDTIEIWAEGATRTRLTMYKTFEGFPGHVIFYKGYLSATKITGKKLSAIFASWTVDASIRGDGVVAQRQCPLLIYSARCGVTKAAHEVETEATDYASGVVTVPGAAEFSDGHFTGGIIEINGETRMITKHTADQITLGGVFPILTEELAGVTSGGVLVRMYPGCDHSASTCATKFSNTAKHLGFPLMKDNPFIKRVI